MCGEVKMGEVKVWKWLADSVAETVAARMGRVKAAGLEIAEIINDWRARAAGGLDTALLLWEACVIPSLLYGAGTWVAISAATIKSLNNLQRWFLRLVLQVPQGTPTAALTWETGVLEMGLRVKIEKLLLVLHIRSLDEDSFAKKVYEEQKINNWPGLAKESKEISEFLNVEDVNITNDSKKDYKKKVMLACALKDEAELRLMAENIEKCNRIMADNYGQKEYIKSLNIQRARETFRTRTNMQRLAGNFSHDQRFAATGWMCRCLLEREEVAHLTSGTCPTYMDIFENFEDLSTDENLVKFFGEILARRDALDREEG